MWQGAKSTAALLSLLSRCTTRRCSDVRSCTRTMSAQADQAGTGTAAQGDAARPGEQIPALSAEDAAGIVERLDGVRRTIREVCGRVGRPEESVTLVAVSKTKSAAMVKACYDAGQRHFGENYAQELLGKAEQLPPDIRWHFIGTLQSNKCKMLLGIPNLYAVEAVQSIKHVRALANACEAANRTEPLSVFVQVNTSGETKSGASPGNCALVAQEVLRHPDWLKLSGLMTIGRPAAPSDQPDFRCLVELRARVAEETGLSEEDLGLSMGMSADYEAAIEFGSTNVRVGSTIFGARQYPKKE